MVEIHFYGKLRQYVGDYQPGHDAVLLLEPAGEDTMASLLERMEVPVDEVNHIFLNARLLASRNRAASFYGYPQSGANLSDWNLHVPVGSGDRIGLFGRDMAILGM